MHFQRTVDALEAARECALGAACKTGDKDEILTHLDAAEMALQDLRQAIRARLSGKWDCPSLVALGPLMPDTETDILRLLDA